MAITLVDLKERLARIDEVSLLELLHLDAQDIIDRFEDIIEERYEDLLRELEGFSGDEDADTE